MIAYISIGSNIDPEKNIYSGLLILKQYCNIISISTFYKTKPLLEKNQNDFYNGIFQIDTEIPLHDLKQILKEIEKKCGRTHSLDKYESRTLDLDLILYGSLLSEHEAVPDINIYKRAFIAIPLYELNQDLILPGSGTLLKDLIYKNGWHTSKNMIPLEEFTLKLRRVLENE